MIGREGVCAELVLNVGGLNICFSGPNFTPFCRRPQTTLKILEQTKGQCRKRVVLADRCSRFRYSFQGNMRAYRLVPVSF